MDHALLQDRLSRGMGAAARVFGAPYDLMRPRGTAAPTRTEWRVLRLSAAFDGGDPGYRRPRGYDRALRGTFDSAYVAVGDYLVGPRGTLFVALLPPLHRPLCVLTNAVLDLVRPGGAIEPGLNPYGGVGPGGFMPLLQGWPAQVLVGGAGRPGSLPGDGALSEHAVLLPPTPASIQGGDVLRDQAGRRFVVNAAELSEPGWRISARLVGV